MKSKKKNSSALARTIENIAAKQPGISRLEIARLAGCGKSTVYKILGSRKNTIGGGPTTDQDRLDESGPGVTKDFDSNKGFVEFRVNKHIKDINQALEEQGVDLNKWVVERVTTTDNAWDVTMKNAAKIGETYTNYQFKISVWLKPKVPNATEESLKMLVKALPRFRFTRVPRFTAPSGVAAEIALLDAHFGKMAWAMETGRRDYDLKIASADYLDACAQNLAWVSHFEPEKIYFILGQDLMHIENYTGTTFHGHNVLDVDTRLPKVFFTAMETAIKCVYMCRDIADTEVVWVPGNHDLHASLFLACALKQHFRKDKHVEVDVSPMQRKARLWGNLLVGWTHGITGRHEAWVNELAHAFPELWGKSIFREWHFGHKHKKREIKTHPTMTQGGVMLRQLTALSPIDAWHFENLFTDAVPGGESLVWTKDKGVIANYTAWTDLPVRQNN